jgi:hypothetical protein
MTCVWDSIIRGIPIECFRSYNFAIKPDAMTFVKFLKNNNKKVSFITVNDQDIKNKEREENYKAVKELNIKTVNQGYFTSSKDPFLILICELFRCSIYHNYRGHLIKYEHQNPLFKIHVHSSSSHMSYQKTEILKKY